MVKARKTTKTPAGNDNVFSLFVVAEVKPSWDCHLATGNDDDNNNNNNNNNNKNKNNNKNNNSKSHSNNSSKNNNNTNDINNNNNNNNNSNENNNNKADIFSLFCIERMTVSGPRIGFWTAVPGSPGTALYRVPEYECEYVSLLSGQ